MSGAGFAIGEWRRSEFLIPEAWPRLPRTGVSKLPGGPRTAGGPAGSDFRKVSWTVLSLSARLDRRKRPLDSRLHADIGLFPTFKNRPPHP